MNNRAIIDDKVIIEREVNADAMESYAQTLREGGSPIAVAKDMERTARFLRRLAQTRKEGLNHAS